MRMLQNGGVRTDLSALSYASRVWESLDTPRSLTCHLLVKYKEYDQLVRLGCDPLNYLDPQTFFLDYQSTKLMSKFPDFGPAEPRKVAAMRQFLLAESQCRETNERFRRYRDGLELAPSRVMAIMSIAARKISRILGDVPSLESLDFRFGPGASYGVRGETSAYNKVTSTLECTYAMADGLEEFLQEFPGWVPPGSVQDVKLVPGNQLSFVPKDAKTDRPICIEPLLNGLAQKGIGSYLKRRLIRFGVNLSDQSINQRLAHKAYDEGLATVDFSSASDTVSYAIVYELLPQPWAEFLDRYRSPRYECEGRWYNFHKFSSMGNAYTFELETLIFYALACACCEYLSIPYRVQGNLHVYGDDVVIPQAAYDLFSEVSKECGFTVNTEKSFSGGSFFESCGQDFFASVPVRPLLIRASFTTLTRAFYAANTIRRIASRIPLGRASYDIRQRLAGVHRWVVGRIPRHLRVMGPEGCGDGHLISSLDEAATSGPTRLEWNGHLGVWRFHQYAEQAKLHLPPGGEWPIAYALYGGTLGVTERFVLSEPNEARASEGYTVRGRTRLRRTRVSFHGEWIDWQWADPLLVDQLRKQ